jgi:hypothetical protein
LAQCNDRLYTPWSLRVCWILRNEAAVAAIYPVAHFKFSIFSDIITVLLSSLSKQPSTKSLYFLLSVTFQHYAITKIPHLVYRYPLHLRVRHPVPKMSWDTSGGGGGQWGGGAETTTFNDSASANGFGGGFGGEGGDVGEASGGFGGGNRGACFNCGEEG